MNLPCVANARLEGQVCDTEDVAAIRRIISGETTLENELDVLDGEYREKGLRPSLHGAEGPATTASARTATGISRSASRMKKNKMTEQPASAGCSVAFLIKRGLLFLLNL